MKRLRRIIFNALTVLLCVASAALVVESFVVRTLYSDEKFNDQTLRGKTETQVIKILGHPTIDSRRNGDTADSFFLGYYNSSGKRIKVLFAHGVVSHLEESGSR